MNNKDLRKGLDLINKYLAESIIAEAEDDIYSIVNKIDPRFSDNLKRSVIDIEVLSNLIRKTDKLSNEEKQHVLYDLEKMVVNKVKGIHESKINEADDAFDFDILNKIKPNLGMEIKQKLIMPLANMLGQDYAGELAMLVQQLKTTTSISVDEKNAVLANISMMINNNLNTMKKFVDQLRVAEQ